MKARAEIQTKPAHSSNEGLSHARVEASSSAIALSVAASSVHEREKLRITQIRELAYRLYEERGCLDGRDVENWLEAETIIAQQGKLAA